MKPIIRLIRLFSILWNKTLPIIIPDKTPTDRGIIFLYLSKFLNFISLILTAMTVKNKRKIACFGFSTKDKIGSATKGNPKLMTPLTNPPKVMQKVLAELNLSQDAQTSQKHFTNIRSIQSSFFIS